MLNPLFFIGSLPFIEKKKAIDFVKKHSSHLPFLPQLPALNPNEDMVAQIVTGLEKGHWDESSSVCLEGFLSEFHLSPRLKIQMAGPLTVSRQASVKIDSLIPHWVVLYRKITEAFFRGGFKGELWLQIDEPSWSKDTLFPKSYEGFLAACRGARKNSKIGIHSCNFPRPDLPDMIRKLCHFFSFDFFKSDPSDGELSQWVSGTQMLVAGLIERNEKKEMPEKWRGLSTIYLSSTCGLLNWKEEEIEKMFHFPSS